MSDSDSDQPPDLVYSSDSDVEYDHPPEFSTHGAQWTRSLEQVVKIRTLAPFVLSCFFGSETWKSLMVDSGLLTEQWLNGDRTSIPTLLKRVELMEHFTDCVTRVLRSDHKRQLAYSLLENLRSVLMIKHVLPAASGHQLIDKVRKYLTMCPPDGDKDKVTLGVLYACYQYVEVLKELKYCDYVNEIVKLVHKEHKCIEQTRGIETTKNDNDLNQMLVNLYTEAIQERKFSYKLYAQRSKAYLKMADGGWLALVDAKCSMILNDKYLEGHYLYILASFQLKQEARALEALVQLELLYFVSKADISQCLCKLAMELGLTQTMRDHPFLAVEMISSAEPSSRLKEVLDHAKAQDGVRARRWTQSEPRTPAVTSSTRSQSRSRDRRKKNKKKNDKHKLENDVPPSKESRQDKPSSSKAYSAGPQSLSKDDYKKKAAQGSNFLLNQDFTNAVSFYKQAVGYDIGSPLKLDWSDVNSLLVLYGWATALKKLATKKDLAEAVDILQKIIEAEPVRAMVHLTLGEVYYLQTQFDKSEEILQRGLTLWQDQRVLMWPGTDKLIDESKCSVLKNGLDNLIISCQNPPPPVAKCCRPKEVGHLKVNIYVEDPEFKGYVRCLCFAKCIIEYHLDCWKKVSNKLGRLSKKDLINTECLTPDCNALIKSVTFYDMEGNEKRKIENEKPEGRPVQQPVPRTQRQAKCERNLQLWEKRKMARKQKRLLAREEARKKDESLEKTQTDLKDGNLSTKRATGETSNVTVEKLLPPSGDIEQFATVLKKDSSAEDKTQVPRRKKRKEKLKKNMTLVEFVGNQDSDDEEGGYFGLNSENWDMFAEPRPLSSTLNLHANPFEMSSSPLPNAWSQPLVTLNNTDLMGSAQTSPLDNERQVEDQTANENTKDFLYSYFHDILKHHGPLKLSDPIITDGLKEFPEDILQMVDSVGGIGPFLSNNYQFEVMDGVVFLIQDRAKGLAIVQEQKRLLIERCRTELAQSLLPKSSRNKKRKKHQADTARDYNYMDEECLSERSWPGSEVSETSKSTVPSNVSPPVAISDVVDVKQPATAVASFPTVSSQVTSSSPSQFMYPVHMFNPFKSYTSCMNNGSSSAGSLVQVSSSVVAKNHALSSGSNHLSGNGSGSLTSVKAPEKLSASTANNIDNGIMDVLDDDDDDDDDLSICSGFSMSSKHFREQDHMDGGLEISNMNADILGSVTGLKSDPTSTNCDEPINISLSAPEIPKKKSMGRKKKSAPKSTIDVDKIKSKLSMLSRPKDLPDQTKKQPAAKESNLLHSSSSDCKSSQLPLLDAKTGQISISYIEAASSSSYLNVPNFTSCLSDNESLSSRGSLGRESSTTNSTRSIIYKETGINTDTVMADWTKMQETIGCLQEENALLKESLEREEQRQHEVTTEHYTQMENIITKLNRQTEVVEALIKKLKQERLNHETETTQLKSQISNLKARLATVEDTAQRTDEYGIEETENGGTDTQAASLMIQDNIPDLDAEIRSAEMKPNECAKTLKIVRDKNLPVPPEDTAKYNKFRSRLQQLCKQQAGAAKKTWKEPVIKKKSEASETRLKLLQVPDLPLLPNEMSSAVSFDKQHTPNSQVFPGHQPVYSRQSSKITSDFDKIVSQLRQMFPDSQISDIKQHILDFRYSRGGSLSGLRLADIILQVASNITKKTQGKRISGECDPPAWMPLAQPSVVPEEVFEENDPCVICLEELTPDTELRNECGHRFHGSCIREWLKRNRICPTCRQHILLRDEFPSLR